MGVGEGEPDNQVSIDAPRNEGVAPDKSTEHSGQEFPGWTEELSGFAEYIDYITEGADSDAGTKGSQVGVGAEGTNRLIPTPVPEEKDPAVECPDTEENEVVICQLRSSSMLKVAVSLNNVPLQAVVDTAAEVTIISDRVLQMLEPAPQEIRDVVLSTAGRDMKMKGVVVGPVHIKLGEKVFTENIYTAPISDDMLLGLDFLCRHSTAINIGEKQLEVGLQKIPLSLGHTRNPDKVAQVYTQESTTIPPNALKRITGTIDQKMGTFIFEPLPESHALILRTLHDGGKILPIYILNPTDRTIHIEGKKVLGRAYEVEEVVPSIDPSSVPEHKVQGIQEDKQELPEHVQDLYMRSSELLDETQQAALKNLLIGYADVFARNDFDLGEFVAIEHRIDTKDEGPVKQKMRRTPLSFAGEEKAHLQRMEEAGVIQPSHSEWASAPVLVRKRDGGVRWCVDYRGLNAITRKDVYPLPNIEECLDTLSGTRWFSKLDANSAYWQVRIAEEDRKKTAFTTKYGLYEFVRMGFGLCNAPATFSRAMDLILRGLNWDVVLAFLDDVVVLGKTFEDHMGNLQSALQRFRSFQLKLKPRKCELFRRQVEFLGRNVGANKISLKPEHVEAVLKWPTPTSAKQVEKFLGLANYHRTFMKDYATVAVPLYRVTGKNQFQWGPAQQQAFDKVKELLTTAPVLTMPTLDDEFILDTDASGDAIGAELIQLQEGEERVIAYGSMSLAPEQRRYCVTRLELLALVRFTRHYRHYLLGRQFTVRTDHHSLLWLLNFKYPQGQLARWIEELSQYHLVVEYRPGKRHANADALSRIPVTPAMCEEFRLGFDLQDLPCGGCAYCTRAHKNWAPFVETVDNVVPLASQPKEVNGQKVQRIQCIVATFSYEGLDVVESLSTRLFRLHGSGEPIWSGRTPGFGFCPFGSAINRDGCSIMFP